MHPLKSLIAEKNTQILTQVLIYLQAAETQPKGSANHI
jgi:hypothetical protein